MSEVDTVGETPRDVRQYYDKRHQYRRKENTDPYQNIQMMVAAETNIRYIRRVTTDPDNHSVVLFTDEMIAFIERHCGRTSSKSPMHVDTTYNLTNGYSVVCTLRAVDFGRGPAPTGPHPGYKATARMQH